MLSVPIQATPSQVVNIALGGQACTLNVYAKSAGVFMDVYVSGSLIIGGAICQNFNRIVRDAYLGFVGDFSWWDTQGSSDPTYDGFGTRYVLTYLEASDL